MIVSRIPLFGDRVDLWRLSLRSVVASAGIAPSARWIRLSASAGVATSEKTPRTTRNTEGTRPHDRVRLLTHPETETQARPRHLGVDRSETRRVRPRATTPRRDRRMRSLPGFLGHRQALLHSSRCVRRPRRNRPGDRTAAAGGLAIGVALTVSSKVAILIAAVVLGVRMLEDYLVVPRILGDAVGLTSLVVLVSVTSVGILFGGFAVILADTDSGLRLDSRRRHYSQSRPRRRGRTHSPVLGQRQRNLTGLRCNKASPKPVWYKARGYPARPRLWVALVGQVRR